uniref:Toll-like receptor 5 n=1 Tax=Rhipicephalus appendiculatus TaxID=34631 RepID=A0A131YLL6_RHIAP
MVRIYWMLLLLQCCSVPLVFAEPSCQKFQSEPEQIFFNCGGFTTASELATKIIRPEHSKHAFMLSESRLEHLPVDTFQDLAATNVTLNKVHIDNFEASHPNAFERLNGTLVELVFLRGSTLPKSWSLLKDVLSLVSLRFERQVVVIDQDWNNLPHSLRDIFITECTVSSMEQGALASLTNLEQFDITSSRLGNFTWSVLPNPAPYLHTILLRRNELTEIPKGFNSQQFPALKSIHLESNAITTWDAETLDAIRTHPNNPRLYLGAIPCDCRIRTLLEFPRERISGTCSSPDSLKHHQIDEIRVEDLRC